MKIELKRKNNAVHFEASNEDGVRVNIDGSPELGGENRGARPMQMLLMALGGCSGIDVVSILKKQRQEITDFHISIEAEREKGKEPALFETIHVRFQLTGNLDKEKVERAVSLSMDKYCSVAKTLEKTAKITYSVSVNETLKQQAQS